MVIHQNTKTDEEKFYKTQNRDIQLKVQENGKWDLTLEHDDYSISKGLDSLFNACVIACLTGYNEIGDRYENETYSEFGNHAYELLKQNKSNLVMYKLEGYFQEVLKNIRRVKKVNEVTVTESSTDAYAYDVFFNVTGLDDQSVHGTLSLTDTNNKKIGSNCIINITHETRTNNTKDNIITNPIGNTITAILKDSRNRPISKQIVRLYSETNDLLTVGLTDNNGQVTFAYTPSTNLKYDEVHATYDGDTDLKDCISNTLDLIYAIYFTEIVNGELIYSYNTETPHPTLSLNDKGELLVTYDTDYFTNPRIEGRELYIDMIR